MLFGYLFVELLFSAYFCWVRLVELRRRASCTIRLSNFIVVFSYLPSPPIEWCWVHLISSTQSQTNSIKSIIRTTRFKEIHQDIYLEYNSTKLSKSLSQQSLLLYTSNQQSCKRCMTTADLIKKIYMRSWTHEWVQLCIDIICFIGRYKKILWLHFKDIVLCLRLSKVSDIL